MNHATFFNLFSMTADEIVLRNLGHAKLNLSNNS